MYYTVIKRSSHLRTLEKCRKHPPAARVFYNSLVFSNACRVLCNISKTSKRVSTGFQTRETFETTRPQAEWFYCFRAFGNLMKPEARVFEITSAWWAWSYHLIAALWQFLNIHRCHIVTELFVSSERTHCFAKQIAEGRFRPPKTSLEEENCVANTIPKLRMHLVC